MGLLLKDASRDDFFNFVIIVNGLVFGAAVLLPILPSNARQWWRITGLAVACVCSYLLANIVVAHYAVNDELAPSPVAFQLSGLAGAFVVLVGLLILIPASRSWRLLWMIVVAGLLGGWALDLLTTAAVNTKKLVTMPLGHAAWQMLICIALHFGEFGTRKRSGP